MDEKKPEAIRAKFTPFPRLKKSTPGKSGPPGVDLKKIKEMYINGTHFRWSDFCRAHNFNPDSCYTEWYNKHVNWEQWKKDWIKHRNVIAEEDITPEMLSTSKLVAVERIKYVQDWTKIASNMKAMLVHLMNEHMQDIMHDQQNALAIRAKQTDKRCKLTPDEMSTLAAAGQRIEELQARALMMVVDPKKTKDLEDEAQDGDSDEIPEFEIHPLGDIMNSTERTALLASYFDQFQKPAELPAPPPEVKDASQDQG